MSSLKIETEQAIDALLKARNELQDIVHAAVVGGDEGDLTEHGYAMRIQAAEDGVRLVSQILRRLGYVEPVPEPEPESEVEDEPEPVIEDEVAPEAPPEPDEVKQAFDMEKVPKILQREAEDAADPQSFLFERLRNLDNSMFLKVGFDGLSLSDTTAQAQALRQALYEVADRPVELPD